MHHNSHELAVARIIIPSNALRPRREIARAARFALEGTGVGAYRAALALSGFSGT
jgi:hypothetical protein